MVEKGILAPNAVPESQQETPVRKWMKWVPERLRRLFSIPTLVNIQNEAPIAECSDDSFIRSSQRESTLQLLEDAVDRFSGPQQTVVEALAREAARRGGSAFIGSQTYAPHEEMIAQGAELPNDALQLLLEGSVDIIAMHKGNHETLIETITQCALLGEMSGLGLSKTTTTVRAGKNGAFTLKIPASHLRALYADPHGSVHKAIDHIARTRLEKQRSLSPASIQNIQATLSLALQLAGRNDANIGKRIREMIPEGHTQCSFETYQPGSSILKQHEPVSSIVVIIDGTCSIIQHGVRVAAVGSGATLGDAALMRSDGLMPFSVEADTECKVLRVSKNVFATLQKQAAAELREKAAQRFQPLEEGESSPTVTIPSQLELDVVFEPASQRQHYRAKHALLTMSALPRVGDSDQMLHFLHKLGLLQYDRKIAHIVAQHGSAYTLLGREDPVDRKQLTKENLEPVLNTADEIRQQLAFFTDYHFSADDARFLLQTGYMVPTEGRDEICESRIEELQRRLPAIKRASFYLDEALHDKENLRDALKQLLFDFEYPLTLTSLLASTETRTTTINAILDITNQPRLSDTEFRRSVQETLTRMDPAFVEASRDFDTRVPSLDDGLQKTMRTTHQLYQASLKNPSHRRFTVSGTGSDLTPQQQEALDREVAFRTEKIEPILTAQLQSIMTERDSAHQDGFPFVSCRTKTVQGVVDKVSRMRRGNADRPARPAYTIGDMPDITGGRIIARDINQLKQIIDDFEQKFVGRIIQKDNFYVSESKRQNPYRVITYTVLIGQYPCEVQLSTLHASIAADIGHNMTYKPIAACSFREEEELKMLGRQAALYDLTKLISHNLAEAMSRLRLFNLDENVLLDFASSLDFKETKSHFLKALHHRLQRKTMTQQETETIINMLEIAERAHRSQTYAIQSIDKKTGKLKYPSSHLLSHIPYINHSVRVATYAVDAGLTVDAVIAALFHDTLEDQPEAWEAWAKNVCPPHARELVESLSEKPGEPRDAYMQRMQVLTGEAKLVKALDRLDNLLRGHTMLSASYLTRTLKECEYAYDMLFARSPELEKFKETYMRYRRSIVHLRDTLQVQPLA